MPIPKYKIGDLVIVKYDEGTLFIDDTNRSHYQGIIEAADCLSDERYPDRSWIYKIGDKWHYEIEIVEKLNK